MKIKQSLTKLIICSLLLTTLYGCTGISGNTTTPSPENSLDLYTSTPSLTFRTPSEKQTNSEEGTDVPKPQSSPTYVIFPNWTSLPKLSPDQSTAKLLEIYENNGGCELPCWWGIVPGETLWETVHTHLSPLGEIGLTPVGDVFLVEFQFVVPADIEQIGYFWPAIVVNNGVVEGIGINSKWITLNFDNSLAGVLGQLGQPNDIRIRVFPIPDPDQHSRYILHLFYQSIGVLVEIRGNADLDEDILKVCPNNLSNPSSLPPGLVIWPPTLISNYRDIPLTSISALYSFNPDEYHLLEDLTDGIDAEEFYDIYRNPTYENCIDISIR